jgi:hypothetical protein
MKETLSNLIAGVQIAFAQPFRLEDAVVVEGEWGWIEEIGTMYVVVRIWDLRRLIVPLSYFLDHPFQNWTRTSAHLLGSTLLHVDYTVPMDELRGELRRICESSQLWRGEVCVLQASDASEHTVQLRALMDSLSICRKTIPRACPGTAENSPVKVSQRENWSALQGKPIGRTRMRLPDQSGADVTERSSPR